MKKVTVNGVDHELSPDSPRSRSHVELLQDMVTSINNLETGTSPDGLELTSTDAAVNVITSASNDATTTASVAALTFKNTVAHTANDLEYNFKRSDDTSLLKIDKEGDTTVAGTVSVGGTSVAMTSTSANTITSATNATNATASVAALTLKAAAALDANDLVLDVQKSDATSLLKVDVEGDTTVPGTFTCAGLSTSGATTALTSTSANLITSATSDANTTVAVAGLTFKNTTAHTSGDLEFEFQKSTGGSLLSIDNEGQADLAGSFTCTGGVATDGLTTPVAGAFTTADTGGVLADATNYYYRISAINDVGESLACAEVTKSTGAGPTGTHTITAVWGTVTGATGYKVYGRTTGAEQLIATVAQGTLSYVDDGSISPSGALPTYNTTSGLNMTALTPNVITSATNDSNTTASVAGLTFKNTAAHTSGDLEYNFVRSDNTSLLSVDTSGVTTAANILQTNGTAIRILNPGTYEVWGTGGVSATSPACTFITKSALTAGYLNFGFNRSDGTQLVTIRNEGQVSLPQLGGTSASATGITTNAAAELRTFVQKVTVTEAALTDADTSQAVTIWTAPAKTRILRIVADVTAAFTGGGVTACTLQVGISGGDADAYIVASDVFSGAVTLGDVEADLGVALSNAGTGAGAFPDFTTTKAIAAQFDSTTATVADLTAGSVTFYIEYCTYA